MAKKLDFSSSNDISEAERQLIIDLEPWVEKFRLQIFRPLEMLWQPEDHLSYGYKDDKTSLDRFNSDLKKGFSDLTDEEMFVFVGNMLTEAGLPNFTSYISSAQGMPLDDNESNAYIRAVHHWSAEESRHDHWGDEMLDRSERVDIRKFSMSRQLFMMDGIDIRAKRSILKTFVYTSFQEQATRVSHHNMAKTFKKRGMPEVVTNVMRMIGSDETLHGQFYAKIIEKALELDPNTTLEAIAYMLHTGIQMPASQMREFGKEPGETFSHFSYAAQETNVYSFADYVKIWNFLLKNWKIEGIEDQKLSEEGLSYKAFILKRVRQLGLTSQRKNGKPIPATEAIKDGEYPWLVRA